MTESATLDFPPIVEPAQEPAQTAIAVAPKSVVTIKEAAVAHLRSHEPTILALAERYRDVALPLDTPKGLAAGQAALTEVRENGRFAVQRARDATKDLLNGAKKDVEAEATRLIALIQPTEAHIEAQITARKAVLAAEKAEKERIEAERVAKHQAGISIIRSYINQAQGKSSEQIARVLPTVEAIDCSPARFEEFSDEACKVLGEVSLALRELLATTKAREEEAARLEAQRAEQARIAAEQAEVQRKLDEQAAELKRRQDEIDRAEREAQAKRDAEAEAARIAALPVAVSVSPVDDNAGSRSETSESETQADPTEALPVAAANSLNITIADTTPRTPAEIFAALLDGREYGNEITDTEASYAKAAGLVVLFGYSDDNMEFRGAIDDEIGCSDGGTAYLTDTGLMRSQCNEGEDCPYFRLAIKTAATIEACWDTEGYSWAYKTEIPHATFEIVEGCDKFCRGIVFELADVNGRGVA